MIKQVLNKMDYSFFAESALVLFVAVFIAVVVRTLLTKSDVIDHQSRVVFNDTVEEQQ